MFLVVARALAVLKAVDKEVEGVVCAAVRVDDRLCELKEIASGSRDLGATSRANKVAVAVGDFQRDGLTLLP